MKLNTYGEFLKTLFQEDRKNLSNNYPGLTIHRLCSEAPVENLEDIYFPSSSHPFNQFIQKIKVGIPFEYISGRAYFFRSSFVVNDKVLIPRNETEILVELAVQEINRNYKNKKCHILDLCTGSGAIGLSVLREGEVDITMTLSDLSPDALSVARCNYFQMEFLFAPTHKVEFIESDLFEKISGEFDLILSNPPYIKEIADRENVHSQVLKHEPHLALFLKDDEYVKWFEKFFTNLKIHLKVGGLAFVEGHETHLPDLLLMVETLGFRQVDLIPDYSQRNRFLRILK